MSITVRNFSKAELDAIAQGTDNWLTTIIANKSTLSTDELYAMNSFNARNVRKYRIWFDVEPYEEPVIIYATGPDTLKRFIQAEYTVWPDSIMEIVTHEIDVAF